VMADLLWLRTNALWEDRDLPGTVAAIKLVTTVDPRPVGFWLNGARMIGYDMSGWRIDAAGGPETVPESVQRRVEAVQAQMALAYLEKALAAHPRHPLIYVEMANLHLHRRGDHAAAAACYRLAAEQPGAPHFAARIHGELLRQLGRDREAYAWLVALHPKLPLDDPAAAPTLVLTRIRALEAKLGIPSAERYRPAAR
jgi:hypothetical protein